MGMRVFATLLAVAGFSTGAMAADLGPYPREGSIKDEPIYTRPFSWTGLYIGAQVGYVWGQADHSFSNGAPSDSSDPDGWVGGGHIGYNLQSGRLVYGVEADFEGGDVQGSFANPNGGTSSGSAELNWQGSVRGRLGLAYDRTLFYATAGWAFGDFDFGGGPLPGPICCGYSETLNGWTVGGGAEHMLTDRVTVRLEYRYTDFGDASGELLPTQPGVIMPVDLSTHALRLGMSLKF